MTAPQNGHGHGHEKKGLDMILDLRLNKYSKFMFSFWFVMITPNFILKHQKILGDKNLRWIISPNSACLLTLCGDRSNYSFEPVGDNNNTAGHTKYFL
jgi:hypothetical protein